MSRNVIHLMLLVSFFVGTPRVIAGFDLTALELRNTTTDTTGAVTIESDRITTITNPLMLDSVAQIGLNLAQSSYDYQWIESLGSGDFDMTLSHAMRNSPGIRTVTRTQIFIEPDEDLIVTVDGSIDYTHTPGDETQFLFGMSVRDINTGEVTFQQTLEGGNADLFPSIGTLSISGTATLLAGNLYRLQTVLDADNLAEFNPGIYDASGFANFSIRPVPEPTTAFLLITAAVFTNRRVRPARIVLEDHAETILTITPKPL